MTDRNLFDSLSFKQVNISPSVIDLTDDFEESSDEDYEVTYPDSFSSSVGKILNERSVSSVLSNVELFYKSQIEYLEDDRYEKRNSFSDNGLIMSSDTDDMQLNNLSDKNEFLNNLKSVSSKQSFSSYYFIKQTFNCPMVLIDHLINTMTDMKLKEDEVKECPKQIEIDDAFETDKSNIITKRDLRMLTFYQPPKPKKPRQSGLGNVGRPPKIKSTLSSRYKQESIIPNPVNQISSFEIIEISDSDDDDLMESTFNEVQEVGSC